MVKNALVGLGIAGVMLAVVGNVSAATATVNVSASITGTCKFDTTPTLAFGALDQALATDATASGGLTFWCTKSTGYTLSDPVNPGVGDGAFAGNIDDGGGNLIPYSISYDNFTGSGGGKTAPITSTLSAKILNADYVDAPAGTYTGNVTFTITP